MVECRRCKKSFKLFPNKIDKFKADGLCGKCRSRTAWIIVSANKDRKTKLCPGCGKKILEASNYCYSCTQTGERNRIYKDGHSCNNRTCSECGRKISTGSGKGKCIACYSKTLSGDGNPNYKFGHYTGDFMNKGDYKVWRKSVFIRDSFKCVLCGKTHCIEAHHILPKRLNPELVFDINNGITLCKKHHETTFGKEIELSETFLALVRPN